MLGNESFHEGTKSDGISVGVESNAISEGAGAMHSNVFFKLTDEMLEFQEPATHSAMLREMTLWILRH